ncbi:hypothetical protein [Streptomyces sp. NBC_00878]|uniref:hypothetical protein n=1 Tax=Streptomyces sp. NBC_00878 TaxID=2975854 RepID=UPI00225385B8|nr:hypothetical protein [Streptomyces sp. NBC_00878]MCX4906861.1 hypothetical protein [Streptomyces sp. NBC_00878]
MTLAPQPLVLRDRIRHALADQPGPVTAAQLAEQLLPPDLESAAQQTARALGQLETTGLAVRQRGGWHGYGRTPDRWTSR